MDSQIAGPLQIHLGQQLDLAHHQGKGCDHTGDPPDQRHIIRDDQEGTLHQQTSQSCRDLPFPGEPGHAQPRIGHAGKPLGDAGIDPGDIQNDAVHLAPPPR